MNKEIALSLLVLIFITPLLGDLLPEVVSMASSQQVESQDSIALSGQELLIEAVDQDGRLGIYALDILNGETNPRLLLPGATNPKWSVGHRKFLFMRDQTMCVYEIDGQQSVWSNDKVLGRFSNPARFEQGKVWWDHSGKANFIDYWPSFGRRLNRSLSLSEDLPLKTDNPVWGGFYDTIVPIRQLTVGEELLSIGAASISPDEEKLAIQMYPSMPRSLGASQSRIHLFGLLYNLAKKDEARWSDKIEQNKANFYTDSVAPQVDGPGRIIGSPTEDNIDIEPLFSPSGKYISFNRINIKSNTVYPVLIDITDPDEVIAIDIEPLANEHAFYPDQVWGWPNHFSVGWHNDQDLLWIVSGREEKAYAAQKIDGTWQTKLVCGLTLNLGSFSHYATYKNRFICMWGRQPNKIFLLNAEDGEKNMQVINLLEGLNVRKIEW